MLIFVPVYESRQTILPARDFTGKSDVNVSIFIYKGDGHFFRKVDFPVFA